MRRYTQFVDEKGQLNSTHASIIMYVMLLDGPTLTSKEIRDRIGKEYEMSMHAALSMTRKMGWTDSPKRGIYHLTNLGRRVWENIFDSALEKEHA